MTDEHLQRQSAHQVSETQYLGHMGPIGQTLHGSGGGVRGAERLGIGNPLGMAIIGAAKSNAFM